jgi:methylmalonyl-CoA mutase N-terminal domain/subunit
MVLMRSMVSDKSGLSENQTRLTVTVDASPFISGLQSGDQLALDIGTSDGGKRQTVRAELISVGDEQGGAIAALESGWLRREIDDVAYRTQLQIERGELAVVGVNRFEHADGDEEFEDDADAGDFEAEQRERLALVRSSRDGSRVRDALDDVVDAARGRHNTIPSIIAAVHARATVGEICAALASVWGRAQTAAIR